MEFYIQNYQAFYYTLSSSMQLSRAVSKYLLRVHYVPGTIVSTKQRTHGPEGADVIMEGTHHNMRDL